MKTPVTIVTGFLGSGKTTLISNLLKSMPKRRLALLVNEFGEVSVDGALLREAGKDGGVEVYDLPNGCICCTVQDDFLPVMKRLQERKGQIDHVIIETSGLALPTPVMHALSWPEIRNDFQLDAVLTVVDAPLLLDGELEDGRAIPGSESGTSQKPEHLDSVAAILNEQLENADVVVLNKIDELTEDQLLAAEQLVRSKAPKVRFLELAYHAQLDTRLCLGLQLHEEPVDMEHAHVHHAPISTMPDELSQPLADHARLDGHKHGALGGHDHGEHSHEHFHEHDTGWQSFVLRSKGEQNLEKLKSAIREATIRQPILRAKGFAAVEGKRSRLVLQAVRSRVQTYFEPEECTDTESSVVFIGYHPSREKTAALLSELSGLDWN
jgi:cobalamin biosynthesis protein CobW